MRRGSVALLFCAALIGVRCLSPQPARGEVLLDADPARDGTLGGDGPLAVARARFDVQTRVTDYFALEVVYPADADGNAAPVFTHTPIVVLIQGTGVAAERYRFLAVHLASRGYSVLLPTHLAENPVLESDNALLAVAALRREALRQQGPLHLLVDDDSAIVLGGHAQGAEVAAQLFSGNPRIRGAISLAGEARFSEPLAFPPVADGDAVHAALCLAGSNDLLRPPERALDGCAGLRDVVTATVQGMNAFAWTDAPSVRELALDGALDGELGALRTAAFSLIDVWLDAVVFEDPAARERLVEADFPGVALSARPSPLEETR